VLLVDDDHDIRAVYDGRLGADRSRRLVEQVGAGAGRAQPACPRADRCGRSPGL